MSPSREGRVNDVRDVRRFGLEGIEVPFIFVHEIAGVMGCTKLH